MRVLDSLKDLLTNKSSVQMVADDPVMSAEIMLLVRMMFADGELSGEELAMFKSICNTVFAIPEDDVPEVINYLKDFGYETTGEQAAALFVDMPEERKRTLMVHLVSLARADKKLHESEINMIARIASVLGLTPEQVQAGL